MEGVHQSGLRNFLKLLKIILSSLMKSNQNKYESFAILNISPYKS